MLLATPRASKQEQILSTIFSRSFYIYIDIYIYFFSKSNCQINVSELSYLILKEIIGYKYSYTLSIGFDQPHSLDWLKLSFAKTDNTRPSGLAACCGSYPFSVVGAELLWLCNCDLIYSKLFSTTFILF